MSIDLMLEVMDHAPADLSSGERLVLIVIAERANDKSRVAKQSSRWTLDTIAHRAGVKRTGLKSIFQGLARKGCEVRVPVKTSPDGKPVFAFEGTAVTFKVPRLAERGGHSLPTERGGQRIPSETQEGRLWHPRGEAVASERGGCSHPQSLRTLKEPSKNSLSADRSSVPAPREPEPKDGERDDSASPEDQNSNPATAAHRMIAKHGIRGVEADRLIAYIHLNVEHPIQGDGWWYAADTNGSLDDWINRYRTAATKTTAAAGTAVAENTPCLLHSRQPAGNCGACWADVLGGCDPYQGRDDERPANFWTIYNRQNRTSQRGESAEATKAAGWLALGTDEQTRWDHNQRIIDHQSEATR